MAGVVLIVVAVAILIIVAGISMIIQPVYVRQLLLSAFQKNWLWPVSILRIVIGMLFIWYSSDCKFPVIVKVIGIVAVAAGVIAPILGKKKLESWGKVFLDLPDYMLRLFGFAALILGIMLAMAGMK